MVCLSLMADEGQLTQMQTSGTQLATLFDEAQSAETQQQAAKMSSEAAIKELATDETLSEETRESAKQALDELAAAQTMKSKNAAMKNKGLPIVNDVVNADMTKYLRGHRLLHYADDHKKLWIDEYQDLHSSRHYSLL